MDDSENGIAMSKILTLEVGGTTIKATVLDCDGKLLQDYKKVPTPDHATPEKALEAIQKLIVNFPGYDKVSIGFPVILKKE
jgi:polyphosphate glucokinase